MEFLPRKFNITVSGNSGSVTYELFGDAKSISIVPPGSATFDLEMFDSDGHYFVAEDDISGTNKVQILDTLYGNYTILISNAADGVYKLRLSWQKL